MGKSILSSIQQLLLIVFSVVLGIFLSERIEERKNDREAELLLSRIKMELTDNKRILDKWVPYHIQVADRLDTLVEQQAFINSFIENPAALYQVFTEGTIMSESPANDAWDIAKGHPLIVHIDYEKLLILSKIYKQQKSAYESVPKMIELFISSGFNTKDKAAENLQTFYNQLREIAGRETQLMQYYQEGEEILEL